MPCTSSTNMSITVEQILNDAKRLVSRLREHDNSADDLLSHVQLLNKKVDSMKRYNEEINELNDVARQRPRNALVQGIQQENRHIRELQQENKEIRAVLEEYQSALELIMSKYREHVIQLLATKKANCPCEKGDKCQMQTEKIYEMAAVMAKAVAMDNDAVAVEQEQITRLITENKGLRELLEISQKCGSADQRLSHSEVQDSNCQTDS
ncbi:FGFR1 oncoprotein partner 2 [Chamberlinius hualienensis]